MSVIRVTVSTPVGKSVAGTVLAILAVLIAVGGTGSNGLNLFWAGLAGLCSFLLFRSAVGQQGAERPREPQRSVAYTSADRARLVSTYDQAVKLPPEMKAIAEELLGSMSRDQREALRELGQKRFEAEMSGDKAAADRLEAEINKIVLGGRG